MKPKRFLILLLAIVLAACSTPTPTPLLSPTVAVPTPLPTIDYATPETVGRAYLEAWERYDYAQMYELLSPELRRGLALEDFAKVHRQALNTTTALTVTLVPQQLGLEPPGGWIDFQERWETALFGTLETDNRLRLIQDEGQWWVDWRRESIWPDLQGGHTFAVEYQVPPRANIYDRTGAGLAVPSTIVTVGVVPEAFQDEEAVLQALAEVLALPPEEIQAEYAGQPANWFLPIADISGEESLAHNELLGQPGIERRERTGRLYPLNGVGSHVVGWVSPIPAELAEEYERAGYRSDARVGIAGLEAWGEPFLAGKNGGRLYLAGPEGEYVRGLVEREPERGRALYTTLERDLQQAAEEILGQRRGAIVALDPQTGAVLAMASGPGFDNNIFIRPTAEWERQAVLNDPQRPLLNRATQGTYPCGSVFKIVTLAATLEKGIAVPGSPFSCAGYWDGLGITNRKSCWSTHGNITLQEGLTESCNVVFYEMGLALNNADPQLLPTYGASFGLGQQTGLEALREAAGLMPFPQWKLDTYFEQWAAGDAVNLAVGQGYLLVTPLQIARMAAALANGGTLYRPYVVARVEAGGSEGEQITQPQAVGQLPISQPNLEVIRAAMLNVTSAPNGTATHRFRGVDVAVAGKTGTAETGGPDPHSWFAGYFPAGNPEVAAVVMVENAGEGSTVAAPMFRQLVEAYYGYERTPLPPTPAPESTD
jgi:penicillin-binding protein 2